MAAQSKRPHPGGKGKKGEERMHLPRAIGSHGAWNEQHLLRSLAGLGSPSAP
jgi:hypothetical protein